MHKLTRALLVASLFGLGWGCGGAGGPSAAVQGTGGGTPISAGGAPATGGGMGPGGTGGTTAPGTGGGTGTGTGGGTGTRTGGGTGTETGGASATSSGGKPGTGGAPASGGVVGSAGGTTAGGAGGLGSGLGGGTATGTQPFKGVAGPACADLARLNVSWWYNWSASPGACTTPEFVPMVAGKNEKTAAAVTAALTRISNAGYKIVLGFNEPNKVDQSNLTVAQVLDLWPALAADASIRVGSPVTSADAQAWFTDFMTQATARNLRVDFIALHWYGWNAGSCDAKALTLENYIKWAEAIPGNRPIWITEWGCLNLSNPDPGTVQAFYSGAIAMFARHPRVERYAWYPYTPNNELVATGGALTPLGQTLAAAAPRR